MLDKELKKLAEAATALGKWKADNWQVFVPKASEVDGRVHDCVLVSGNTNFNFAGDIAYIVAACNETPTLLQRIEELRSALSRVSSHTDYESTAGQIASKALAADKAQEEATK